MARIPDELKGESWNKEVYKEEAAVVVRSGAPVTAKAERTYAATGYLNPLILPASYGASRSSLVYLQEQEDGTFKLVNLPMAVATGLDVTGSMGGNVDKGLKELPTMMDLLALSQNAVLADYSVQVATGIIQDELYDGPRQGFQLSQFEQDNRIDEQMMLMTPQRGGMDREEDYLLALYYFAFCVHADIYRMGLKPYMFLVGDVDGRETLTRDLIQSAFGITEQKDYTAQELAIAVQKKWQVYFLQADETSAAPNYWVPLLGRQHFVKLPRTEDISEVQAVIIGLSEGKFDFKGAEAFLINDGKMSQREAQNIISAVRHINIGEQTRQPGFGKLPKKGDVFDSVEAFWEKHAYDGRPANPYTGIKLDVAGRDGSISFDTPDDDPDSLGWLS